MGHIYSKSGGSVLLLIGLLISFQMIRSSWGDMDWFMREGIQGLMIGLLMAGSGAYAIAGLPHNLIVRAIWSVLFIIGGTIGIFVLVNLSQAGLLPFLLGLISFLLIFVGLVVTTALDIYQRL